MVSSSAPLPQPPSPDAESGAGAEPFPWGWRPAAASLLASEVSLLRLQGPDSLRFLHGQTSQAIELARPGQWLSTCCISPTARMRALAEVLVDGDGAWLVIREGDAAAVRTALDRVLFPADDVHLGQLLPGLLLEPLSAADQATAPQGTAAGAGERPQAGWRPLAGAEGFWLGDALLLAGGSAPSPAGGSLEPAAADLLAMPRLSAAEHQRWRIQMGWPAHPAELNDDTNPYELGLAERVSLSKGCYVGQETLAKLATYDGVKQQLRRWFIAGPSGPATGSALTVDGQRAGQVTSVQALPDASGWIGLALVRRSALSLSQLDAEASDSTCLRLELSVPDAVVTPPVGSGSTASGRP